MAVAREMPEPPVVVVALTMELVVPEEDGEADEDGKEDRADDAARAEAAARLLRIAEIREAMPWPNLLD